jgi:hypothetical protein
LLFDFGLKVPWLQALYLTPDHDLRPGRFHEG